MAAKKKSASKTSRTYGGQSTEERTTERRARLLRAGFELFGKNGYAAATVPGICDRAGVIARYFYESFDSREALLKEVFTTIIEQAYVAVSDALLDAPDDPVERARRTVSAFLHAYLDDPRCARIVCLEVGGVSPALERLRWTEMRRFAAVIEADCDRMAARRILPRRDYRMGSIALAGATNQLIIEFLSSAKRPTIDALEEEVLVLFISVFTGIGTALDALRGRVTAWPNP